MSCYYTLNFHYRIFEIVQPLLSTLPQNRSPPVPNPGDLRELLQGGYAVIE